MMNTCYDRSPIKLVFLENTRTVVSQELQKLSNEQENYKNRLDQLYENQMQQQVLRIKLGSSQEKSDKLGPLSYHFYGKEGGYECFPQNLYYRKKEDIDLMTLALEFPMISDRLAGLYLDFEEHSYKTDSFKLAQTDSFKSVIDKVNSLSNNFYVLKISNCDESINSFLSDFLYKDLTKICFKQCDIENESIWLIAKHALHLKKLEIDSCREIHAIAGEPIRFGDVIVPTLIEFPCLKTLRVTNCRYMNYIGIKAPLLESLSRHKNPWLKSKGIEIESLRLRKDKTPNQERADLVRKAYAASETATTAFLALIHVYHKLFHDED